MAKLLIVGNACVDVYIPPHERPPPGGIRTIDPLDLQIGGNGANTAITAARLGVSTALAGVLGDDVFGRWLREGLSREGVDVARLKLLPDRPSPTTLVYNDERGERSFAHHPGTNASFEVPEIASRAPCRIFHLAAPELLGGIWPRGAHELARRLKENGRVLSLDTFTPLGSKEDRRRTAREHRPLLELVDYAFPNEEEAFAISGRRELRSVAAYFHHCGVGVVAIKRGERGAVVSWRGRFEEVRATRVEAVDTCGAGDAFSAGFLAGTIRGLDPLEATRLGCSLGTLTVQYRGALTGSRDPDRLRPALAPFDFAT